LYSTTEKFGVVMIFTVSPPYVGRGDLSRSTSQLVSRGCSRDNGDETRKTSERRDSHYEDEARGSVRRKRISGGQNIPDIQHLMVQISSTSPRESGLDCDCLDILDCRQTVI
jgi:hypothetical protein